MPRREPNIYKRKDNRWKGRLYDHDTKKIDQSTEKPIQKPRKNRKLFVNSKYLLEGLAVFCLRKCGVI